MSSFYLLSPDPNKQCCGCRANVNAPCSSCSSGIILSNLPEWTAPGTGFDIFEGSSAITLNGKGCYSYTDGSSNLCFECTNLASYPGYNYTGNSTNIRSYTSPQASVLGFMSVMDGNNNVPVTIFPFAQQGLSPSQYYINYTLRSSVNGLVFQNTNSQVFSNDGNCLKEKIPSIPELGVPLLIGNFNSGETLSFTFSLRDIQTCPIIPIYSTAGNNWVFNTACNQITDNVVLQLARQNTGVYNWATSNNTSYNNQVVYLFQPIIAVSGTNNIVGPYDNDDASAYCGQNFYPSATSVGGGSCVTAVNGAGNGNCVDSSNQICCSNTIYNVLNGTATITVTFQTSECIQLTLTQSNGLIATLKSANGSLIDPISRLLSIGLATGNYVLCNSLP